MQEKLEVPYEPFLHATNSSILAILPKTQFQLMSPLEMMDTFLAGPVTGELTEGGYDNLGVDDGFTGKTSFIKISSKNLSLEDIIRLYLNREVLSPLESLRLFQHHLKLGMKSGHENLDLLLIYFVQCRQYYDSLDKIISRAELEALFQSLNAVIPLLALMKLFKRYIHVNVKYINASSEKYALLISLDNLLLFEYLSEKLIKSKIDLEEISKNPTEENLIKIIEFLQKNQAEDLFSLYPSYDARNKPFYSEKKINKARNNSFAEYERCILINALTSQPSLEELEDGDKEIEKMMLIYQKRITLFKKLVEAHPSCFILQPSQLSFLKKPSFPLIFLSSSSEIKKYCKGEYRSLSPLKLGNDIHAIATNNHNSRLLLLKYMDLYNIRNILIILLDDLYIIRSQKLKLATSYQHADGIPKLQWLAAKKVKRDALSELKRNLYLQNCLELSKGILNNIVDYLTYLMGKEVKTNVQNGSYGFFQESLYSKRNIEKAISQIEDALQYHTIELGF
ncbi:hypothetical protein B1207_01090 [Legionella quinlivanii]|uniref:Uncharacterized protein n=1 Tax=Legionella quinlivanii TaxID=45073 RepID=A0A364LN81_9GAMM|nr:hypothetical protein [Legionella quinlivanii]RAP38512.1 hypothetical protein B1207_01090 [Legionella quinlivanii]